MDEQHTDHHEFRVRVRIICDAEWFVAVVAVIVIVAVVAVVVVQFSSSGKNKNAGQIQFTMRNNFIAFALTTFSIYLLLSVSTSHILI